MKLRKSLLSPRKTSDMKRVLRINARSFQRQMVDHRRYDQSDTILASSKASVTAGPNEWSGKAASDLIQKISNAKTIVTRYQRWPYRGDIDVEMDAFGFQVATEYLRWAVRKQK